MSWYALVVPAQREIAAVKELSAVCEAFAPTTYVVVRQARVAAGQPAKKTVRQVPLLTRYVFARDPDWYAIRRLQFPGTLKTVVNGVLSADGTPYRLPNADLLEMRRLAEQGPPQVPVSRGLAAGDIVQIIDGSFAGFRVKVIRPTDAGAMVEFTFLSALREIEVPRELLQAA